MSIAFLPMCDADISQVAGLEAGIQPHPWTEGNFRDSLAAGYGCWVAREDGALVAFAVVMPAVDEIHLLVIGVAPERQRSGLGAAMLEFVQAAARAAGMVRMLLEVRPSNGNALAFYRRHGFAEIGRRRAYYPAGEGREDAIVMARAL